MAERARLTAGEKFQNTRLGKEEQKGAGIQYDGHGYRGKSE